MKLELKRKVGFQVDGAGLGHCWGRERRGHGKRLNEKIWSMFSKMHWLNVTVWLFLPFLFVVLVIVIIYNPEAEILKKNFIFLSTIFKCCAYKKQDSAAARTNIMLKISAFIEFHASIPILLYVFHYLWYTTINYFISPNFTSNYTITTIAWILEILKYPKMLDQI